TAMELLKLLKERNDLTLLTNSAEAFHELAQSEINVVSTGGELNKNTLSLQGRITKEIISRYHVDIMVMSCKGLDMKNGALDSNEAEAEIKKTMIRQATEVALLVDHSKFDRKAFVQLVDFSHINYLITNKAPGAEWIAFCKENNIQLVY
ncbi:TPA: DeoR/GlpR transcriptional regulator, partial [Klebsiella pneumoniae subsp. pneumoniae]|nr:DeoR/GlpR transcriptional regulator [Klebsiella pneumoniae subsp. pneumoniae]